jgi:hypothetical protein
MKNVAIYEDDECLSIAESIVDEIELISGEKLERLSADCNHKANFKELITKRAKVARPMK